MIMMTMTMTTRLPQTTACTAGGREQALAQLQAIAASRACDLALQRLHRRLARHVLLVLVAVVYPLQESEAEAESGRHLDTQQRQALRHGRAQCSPARALQVLRLRLQPQSQSLRERQGRHVRQLLLLHLAQPVLR